MSAGATVTRVIVGDCLDVMPTLGLSAFDAIVTDPPYGLRFMGKAWDRGVPGPMYWAQAMRVIRPGGYLLAFGGTRTFHRLACAIEDAGWELHDCLCWLYGSGFPKHESKLKPAWEPIIMARSPMGTATALNIDACRIATAETPESFQRALNTKKHEGWQRPWNGDPAARDRAQDAKDRAAAKAGEIGRWPANVVVDEAAAEAIDEQAPRTGAAARASGPTLRAATDGTVAYGARNGLKGEPVFHGDSGGASRFYYCAKASRSERDAGLENFDAQPLRWSNGEQNPGSFQSPGTEKSARNNHPTVKPIALMRWLARLVTPPGGRVLDMFAGSYSTGCACALEGFGFTGIERDERFTRIGEARMAYWAAPSARERGA